MTDSGGERVGERVAPVEEFADGKVKGAGSYAVGLSQDEPFAVTRRCRHFGADLANGHVDADGCLVCPWHASAYDVKSGRMVRGPQGIFAKVPGLGWVFRSLTLVLPLGRGKAVVHDGDVYVE